MVQPKIQQSRHMTMDALVIDACNIEIVVRNQDLDVGACRDAGAAAQLNQLVNHLLARI